MTSSTSSTSVRRPTSATAPIACDDCDDCDDRERPRRPNRARNRLNRLNRLNGLNRIVVGLASVALLIVLALASWGYGATQSAHSIASYAAAAAAAAATQPAIHADFADPAILVVGGVYYAYATSAAGRHIQAARSTDLRHWTLLPDALPGLPGWVNATDPQVWAPDVIEIGAQYVMYYTARDAAAGRQCIGVATSDHPAGPFRDTRARPFVCQRNLGGDIDASPFRDGDALYLYFKSDGNCCHMPTHIWGQRLASDGLRLIGAPVALLTNDQRWEGDVIEAPNMLKHDDHFDLFYSGNDYASDRYAIGYARCQSPLGPCAKTADSPILASDRALPIPLLGPGGASLFQADGSTWIAFHTWGVTKTGALVASRHTLIDRLDWRGEEPVARIPTPMPPPHAVQPGS